MVEGPDSSRGDEVFLGKNELSRRRGKEEKQPTKVVIRKLPGCMTERSFLEHVSPLFEHDYFYFVHAENPCFVEHNYSRAYINFVNLDDVFTFTMKFDDYVFIDDSGQEYPAIVEFAPFQRIPKNRHSRKNDSFSGTIDDDPEYQEFLQQLESEEQDYKPNQITEHYFDLANEDGDEKVNTTTPLIEFITSRKHEWIKYKEEKKEERRRRDVERRKLKEENKRIRRESKESAKAKASEKIKDEKRKDTDNRIVEDVKTSSGVRIKGKSYQEERQRDLARRRIKEKAAVKGDGKENEEAREFEKTSSYERSPDDDGEKYDNGKENKDERKTRDGKHDDDYKRKKNYEDKKVYRDDDRRSGGYLREKDEKKSHSYGIKKREYTNGYEHESKYKSDKCGEYFYEDYKIRSHSSYQKISYSCKVGSSKSKDYEEKAAKRYDSKSKKYDCMDYKDLKKNYQRDKELRRQSDSKDDQKSNVNVRIIKQEKFDNGLKNEDYAKESETSASNSQNSISVSEIESAKHKESTIEEKKDDRAERRIKNKDRPALEIYRPGMGKFSRQRLERNKSTESKDGD